MKTCTKCKKEYENTGPAQKFCSECKPDAVKKPKAQKKRVTVAETATDEPPKQNPCVKQSLVLLLDHYPHIFSALEKEAIKDFRAPELQAVYYIDMMTAGVPEKKHAKKKEPEYE